MHSPGICIVEIRAWFIVSPHLFHSVSTNYVSSDTC